MVLKNENYSYIVKILWSSSSCRKYRELSVNFVDGSCVAIRPLYPLYERGERVRYSFRASKQGQALGAVALYDGVGELLLELDKEMD